MCDLFSGLCSHQRPALAYILGDVVNSKGEQGEDTVLCRCVTLEEDPEVAAFEELIILEEMSALLDAKPLTNGRCCSLYRHNSQMMIDHQLKMMQQRMAAKHIHTTAAVR